MKKIIVILFCLLLGSFAAKATPAYPYPVKVRQSDGSYVTMQLHGDEFYHWATIDGVEVSKGKDGSFHKAPPSRSASRIAQANMARARRDAAFRAGTPFNKGNNRFLVILVNFADLEFSIPNARQEFSDMLNKAGYSNYGATGSVHDYYYENSRGAFEPVFDVVGPVTISGGHAQYGGNVNGGDSNPRGLVEACDTLFKNGTVNFADYDNNKDGIVDNVFFYYAGHNEAEGGGEDTIWPHASVFSGEWARTYGSVRLSGYNCTSEYKGSEGNTMCGIGTFCHEFGHRLGLPDFYDTDYEENGNADDLMAFSLMSGGNYNNEGRTPPYLTSIERQLLDWMDAPEVLTANGNYTLEGVQNNAAYIANTNNPGEYFLMEVRTGTGWDAYIKNGSYPVAQGMIIYHIDQSDYVLDGISAKLRWTSWAGINAYASHPCMYIKYANPNYHSYAEMLFPGLSGVTEFSDITTPEARAWDGESACFELSNIAYSAGVSSFTFTIDTSRKVVGIIKDTGGNPVSGATVSISEAEVVESVMHRVPGKPVSQLQIRRAAKHSVATGEDGSYSIVLNEGDSKNLVLTIGKDGYKTYTLEFTLSSGRIRKDIILKRIDETGVADLKKYQEVSGYGIGYGKNPADVSAAVGFTAKELEPYAGMKIASISFLFYCTKAEKVDAFVDFGDQRYFTQSVAEPGFVTDKAYFTTVNIENAGVVIPSGKDIFIGYALKGAEETREGRTSCYPVAIDTLAVEGGGYIKQEYATTGGGWYLLGYQEEDGTNVYCNAIISCTLEDNVSPFYKYQILTILSPRKSYSVGDSFVLSLSNVGLNPESVDWYFDGAVQTGEAVTLDSAGKHTVKAVAHIAGGETQEIIQVIQVQ